jgi:hypothetical protein
MDFRISLLIFMMMLIGLLKKVLLKMYIRMRVLPSEKCTPPMNERGIKKLFYLL